MTGVTADIAAVLQALPGALSGATKSLGPDLALAIASPALKRGARDLLQSPEVNEGVTSVALRVGAIVGGCVLAAMVLGHIAGRVISR